MAKLETLATVKILAKLATGFKYRQEREVDRYLVRELKKIGIRVVKLNIKSWPDRMVMVGTEKNNLGRVDFVECKAPGETPDLLQLFQIKKLQGEGFLVKIIDTREKVDQYVREKRDAQLSVTRD